MNSMGVQGVFSMNDQYKNSYKATAKELVSLSVYNVGYQLCDAGYQWGPGIRDHYLIHYIISGKGTYEVHHEVHSLSAGDAFTSYGFTSFARCYYRRLKSFKFHSPAFKQKTSFRCYIIRSD